jgi:hypothetical protein
VTIHEKTMEKFQKHLKDLNIYIYRDMTISEHANIYKIYIGTYIHIHIHVYVYTHVYIHIQNEHSLI